MQQFGQKHTKKSHPSFFSGMDREAEGNQIESPFKTFTPGFQWNFMLEVFSHFNGSDVFHVFSRLSKKVREELPKAKGALEQEKVLRINI